GLARAVGAADGDTFGSGYVKGQRAEQPPFAMRHHDIPERDKLAVAGQACRRQFDRERGEDLDTRTRLAQRVVALLDQALGNAALSRAAVLGALPLRTQQDRGLAAAGAIGAAGLVALCLPLFRLLHAALGIAQGIRGALEIGLGARPRGIACFSERAPCAA